jgi:2-polyprenyl-3-methyl-5-hydroxy-6-metoxy-1,4-benzoquinol methylase
MDLKLKKILSYPHWRHSVELGNDCRTPGHVEISLWDFIGLPKQLKGKSFLDIGANDGLFSIEAERKGASEIVASDLYKDSIDTMKNGWSTEGILLLKDYLNSKIQLHTKGIYHISEMNKTFDVVFMNDIINWLEDIELAFKNLGEVTKEVLYISDGFIIDNTIPKQIKPEGHTLRFMYNLKFIGSLLEKNGFRIEYVKELNYQKVFIKDFLKSPKLMLGENTKVYKTPENNSDYTTSNAMETKGNLEFGDFFHINGIGWVLKKDVKVHYYQPSIFYKISKQLGLLGLYFQFLKNRHKKQSKITAYVIKAIKIKS